MEGWRWHHCTSETHFFWDLFGHSLAPQISTTKGVETSNQGLLQVVGGVFFAQHLQHLMAIFGWNILRWWSNMTHIFPFSGLQITEQTTRWQFRWDGVVLGIPRHVMRIIQNRWIDTKAEELCGRSSVFFMPQKPYMFLGSLKDRFRLPEDFVWVRTSFGNDEISCRPLKIHGSMMINVSIQCHIYIYNYMCIYIYILYTYNHIYIQIYIYI